MDNPMYCPFCKAPLKAGIRRKFENLTDHVCNPNMSDDERPFRDTWECRNLLCIDRTGCFWDSYGDLYTGRKDFERQEDARAWYLKLRQMNTYAIGSCGHWYEELNKVVGKVGKYTRVLQPIRGGWVRHSFNHNIASFYLTHIRRYPKPLMK
jgi:hypothetical protein